MWYNVGGDHIMCRLCAGCIESDSGGRVLDRRLWRPCVGIGGKVGGCRMERAGPGLGVALDEGAIAASLGEGEALWS